jgi:hypothetical protein
MELTMCSRDEWNRTIPDHYTSSNKNLIITAHVGEETAYFHSSLGPHTTVIMLTKPSCYQQNRVFLDYMCELGVTVYQLKESVIYDDNYVLSKRSAEIIGSILKNYNFKNVITHPYYTNDIQNKRLTELVHTMSDIYDIPVMTYNMTGNNKICKIQKGIMELYCKATKPIGILNVEMYDSYIKTAEGIDGIKPLMF